MEIIKINTEYIKLDNLVKFSGITATGGEAKKLINSGLIKVNNEIITQRGKKIKDKDIIEFKDRKIEVRFIES